MKLVKSLLLGSTAVLTAAAGAQAADLPSRKAAPVEYVKICDAYGAGFFFIPGTDTCIRLGGYVRAEYDYTPGQAIINYSSVAAGSVLAGTGYTIPGGVFGAGTVAGGVSQVGSAQDQTGVEIRGRIDIDARTQTSYGTVQSVVHLRAANTDGIRTVSPSSNFETAVTPNGNSNSALTMERAYIRFAGITAGVADENATTMPSYMYSSNVYTGFPNGIKQLVYTATFGGGFSATAGIESQGDFGFVKQVGASLSAGPNGGPTASYASLYNNQFDTGYELVGNVRYDASWGYIQLAGLAGNSSANCSASATSVTGQACGAYNALVGSTKYGQYGFIGSFGVKLPMIAPGDEFHFQAAYGNGFIGATGSPGSFNDLSDASNKRVLGGVYRVDSNLVPTVVSSTGVIDALGQTTSYGVYGIFTHYWTPNWRSNVAAGYWQIDPPTAGCTTTGTLTAATGTACGAGFASYGGLNTQWGRGQLTQVSGNIIWSPTKNFDIGLDVEYLNIRSVLQNPTTAFVNAGSPGLHESGEIYHLRLERTF